MQGKVGFRSVVIPCIIGIHLHERIKKQNIVVDLEVSADFTACLLSDRIQDTVDYCALLEVCEEHAKKNYQLLERYAAEVLLALFQKFPISYAEIRVEKPQALASGSSVVALSLTKEKFSCLGH